MLSLPTGSGWPHWPHWAPRPPRALGEYLPALCGFTKGLLSLTPPQTPGDFVPGRVRGAGGSLSPREGSGVAAMGSLRARPAPLFSLLFLTGTLGPEGLQRLTGECWGGMGTAGQLLMCSQGRKRSPSRGASAAALSPLLLQGALGPRGDTGPPGPPGPPVSKGCSGQTSVPSREGSNVPRPPSSCRLAPASAALTPSSFSVPGPPS